jgi:hypothetical protein
MFENANLLVIASGGLAGAILTQLIQPLVSMYWRPRLRVVFSTSEPGCEVETPVVAGTATQRYLRLKVLNTGRSSADDVVVSVIRIAFRPPGGASLPFREEVLDLKRALTGESPFRIPRDGYQFTDVFLISRDATGVLRFGFDFARNPVRLQTFGFGPGDYSAELFLSANGALSRRVEIKWKWDGSFQGLHAIGAGYMF